MSLSRSMFGYDSAKREREESESEDDDILWKYFNRDGTVKDSADLPYLESILLQCQEKSDEDIEEEVDSIEEAEEVDSEEVEEVDSEEVEEVDSNEEAEEVDSEEVEEVDSNEEAEEFDANEEADFFSEDIRKVENFRVEDIPMKDTLETLDGLEGKHQDRSRQWFLPLCGKDPLWKRQRELQEDMEDLRTILTVFQYRNNLEDPPNKEWGATITVLLRKLELLIRPPRQNRKTQEEELEEDKEEFRTLLQLTQTNKVIPRKQNNRQTQGSVSSPSKIRKLQEAGYHLLSELRLNESMFIVYTRLNFELFNRLLGLCAPYITKQKTSSTLPPDQRLAMTLRYLANGDSLRSISFEYRCDTSDSSLIVRQTMAALVHVLKPFIIQEPKCAREWKEVAQRFYQQWNLPNCLGAIDGRHLMIRCPQASDSEYINYKRTYSVDLIAVADADYSFLTVDVGAEASSNDTAILDSSRFWQKVEAKEMHIPDPVLLPNSDITMPHFFVGDNIFKLHCHLMKPYSKRVLDPHEAAFNYMVSRVRRIVENAFGILKARWQIFKAPLCTEVTSAESIVKATVALHNLIIKSEDPVLLENYIPTDYVDFVNTDGSVIPGQWREMVVEEAGSLRSVPCVARRGLKATHEQRDKLKDYLSNEGAVGSDPQSSRPKWAARAVPHQQTDRAS